MATVCVILSQSREKKIFSLVFAEINLSHVLQTKWRFMMKKIFASALVITLLGSGVYASGCSEMAAFNTKINKALKTASFNKKTLADIKNLQSECKRQHDMGMSVSSINSCKKALDLIAVN